MSPDLELRVCWLYPEYMSIYADRGNILFLQRRCQWRGIGFVVELVSLGDELRTSLYDLYYIGGGQDRDQKLVADDLIRTKGQALSSAVESGSAVLAVCGGYQLLGRSYQLDSERIAGLGLVDIETVRESGPRLIGNCAIEVNFGGRKEVVAGFENHGGRTYLGDGVVPFGQVLKGYGNNGKDRTEGIRKDQLIGTYLHGPLLPKNVALADLLIEQALTQRFGSIQLGGLEDSLEYAAHKVAQQVV